MGATSSNGQSEFVMELVLNGVPLDTVVAAPPKEQTPPTNQRMDSYVDFKGNKFKATRTKLLEFMLDALQTQIDDTLTEAMRKQLDLISRPDFWDGCNIDENKLEKFGALMLTYYEFSHKGRSPLQDFAVLHLHHRKQLIQIQFKTKGLNYLLKLCEDGKILPQELISALPEGIHQTQLLQFCLRSNGDINLQRISKLLKTGFSLPGIIPNESERQQLMERAKKKGRPLVQPPRPTPERQYVATPIKDTAELPKAEKPGGQSQSYISMANAMMWMVASAYNTAASLLSCTRRLFASSRVTPEKQHDTNTPHHG